MKRPSRFESHQVQVRPKRMLVPLLSQLAKIEPLQVQGQNAVLRVVDAALLLVFDGLTHRAHMAVDVEDGRNFAAEVLGFVKQGHRVETGHNLVAQFSYPVARAGLDNAQVLELGPRLDPLLGPTMIGDVVEQMPAEPRGFRRPLLGAGGNRGRRCDMLHQVLFDLKLRHSRRQYLVLENPLKIYRFALAAGERSPHSYQERQKENRFRAGMFGRIQVGTSGYDFF